MGEAILTRRGVPKSEIRVTKSTVDLGNFGWQTEEESTGVSVSDLESPAIGKNVFVMLEEADASGFLGSAEIRISYSISRGYVYARFSPSLSSSSISNVVVSVYKVYM